MMSLVFDTHAAATRFKAAGFSDDQVEALVAVTRETTGLPDISTLATKSDLDQVETRLNHRIDQLDTNFNGKIGHLEGKIDTVRAGLKSDLDQVETRLNHRIDQLETKLNGMIDGVRAELKSDIAELKVMMANMQVQTLTILLPSMVVIVTLATVLSKLIH